MAQGEVQSSKPSTVLEIHMTYFQEKE
jgi:hypothetical protein